MICILINFTMSSANQSAYNSNSTKKGLRNANKNMQTSFQSTAMVQKFHSFLVSGSGFETLRHGVYSLYSSQN